MVWAAVGMKDAYSNDDESVLVAEWLRHCPHRFGWCLERVNFDSKKV